MPVSPESPIADLPSVAATVAIAAVSRPTAVEGEAGPDVLGDAARRGDRAALERLLAEIRPDVYRYVLARLIDRSLADDVTQEVLMTLVATLPRYQDVGRSVRGWAFGIATRKVSEAHRALRRRQEDAVDSLPDRQSRNRLDDPANAVVHLDSTRRMAKMLTELPGTQGEIIRLRVAAGLSAEETAAVLGLTPGAVRVAQHRALAKLRERLHADDQREPDEGAR